MSPRTHRKPEQSYYRVAQMVVNAALVLAVVLILAGGVYQLITRKVDEAVKTFQFMLGAGGALFAFEKLLMRRASHRTARQRAARG